MKKILLIITLILIASYNILSAQNPYSYSTEDYKIDFPDKTNNFTQSKESGLGLLFMQITAYEPKDSTKDNNHLYMIIESKYPDSSIHSDKLELLDNFFRKAIDGTVRDINAILINETKEQIGKYPARTIEINFSQRHAIIKMKLILVKSKFFIIQTITDSDKYPNPMVNQFFDSFILKIN